MGFLLAGIIAGPYAFNLISSQHEVELLSEIGIIFLLFIIGIELSLKELITMKRTVLLGGSLQVGGTIVITASLAYFMGLPLNTAVFVGFLFSLSSTAIVLKILQEKGEITAPHGRISLGVLIFQDIIVVPMMLFTPLLAGASDNILETVGILILKFLILGVVIYLLAQFIVPKVFSMVVKTKSRELFILTVVVFIFGIAWLTSSAGLSLALGAFFAGLGSHNQIVGSLYIVFLAIYRLKNISSFYAEFIQERIKTDILSEEKLTGVRIAIDIRSLPRNKITGVGFIFFLGQAYFFEKFIVGNRSGASNILIKKLLDFRI